MRVRAFCRGIGVAITAAFSVVIAVANHYVLDGVPTGLTSSSGPAIYDAGTNAYSVSTAGPGVSISGTATFKFKWVKDPNHPEPPPKTAIVRIRTTAVSQTNVPSGTACNGWESTMPGFDVDISADEYVAKSVSGSTFTHTVSPSATGGSTWGQCVVSITMTADPVVVSVTNTSWWVSGGNVTGPNILNGERAQATLSAGTLEFEEESSVPNPPTFTWAVQGTKFREWVHTSLPPVTDVTFATNSSDPIWYWNVPSSQPCMVTGTGQVLTPDNQYHPDSQTVTDDLKIWAYRPSNELADLQAAPTVVQGYFDLPANGMGYYLAGGVLCDSGSVNLPNTAVGGTFAFLHKVKTMDRGPDPDNDFPVNEALEHGFPYMGASYTAGSGGQAPDFSNMRFGFTESLPAEPSDFWLNDKLTVYVMFKPSSLMSQWVPIAEADWALQGSYDSPLEEPVPDSWLQCNTHPTWSTSTP